MLKRVIIVVLTSMVLSSLHVQASGITPELKSWVEQMGLTESDISETPIEGIHELQAGTQLYYVTSDGKYLISGNILNLVTKENMTENRLNTIRADVIGEVNADQMISYKAENEKHQVTIFTDIDCGYCRKLHAEMDQYNQQGITVNYLFFPRAGLDSASHKSAVSVWCNQDRNDALTRAKRGEEITQANCNNPVTQHLMLAKELSIRGTPAIITAKGHLMPGYLPAHALKNELEQLAGGIAKQ